MRPWASDRSPLASLARRGMFNVSDICRSISCITALLEARPLGGGDSLRSVSTSSVAASRAASPSLSASRSINPSELPLAS